MSTDEKLKDFNDSYEYESVETTGGKPQRRKHYVKNSELYDELVKWRDSANDVEERIISEELGMMLLKIATHYMNHPNYVRYPISVKQEMVSNCVMSMLKGIKHYDFSKKNPFAYMTQICWSSAMTYLSKYYKFINFKRDKLKEQIRAQVEAGIGIVNGTRYLQMLNDLSPVGSKANEADLIDNQTFIDNLLGINQTSSQPSDTSDNN